ncbi:MAG TPA: hypothetical protein VK187_07750 [Geobacteraceae bacterium]|nr:hypothetical protein [Geobacteraceae bacterium]
MKKLVILILIIAPFAYAYYHKPAFAKHQERIYLDAYGPEATIDDEVYAMPQWDGLEFTDWFIFSATREKKLSSMVSFGLVDRVFVVDSDWAREAWRLKPLQKM